MKKKTKMSVIFLVCIFTTISKPNCADIPEILIELKKSESSALDNSSRLRAAKYDIEAAVLRSKEQKSYLNPKLSLEGYYRYNTEVTEIDLPVPGAGTVRLGDNSNYSFGPYLSWLLWDGGAGRNSVQSLESVFSAKNHEMEGIKRQLLLSCRKAYFQLALAGEQVMMLTEALLLAQTQYKDIQLNARVGTKSRRDELAAHQDVLLCRQQLSQARAEMAMSLRSLSAVTGADYVSGTCIPFKKSSAQAMPEGIAAPTVYIDLEPIDMLLERFRKYSGSSLWASHPDLEVFSELARAAELSSESAASGLWPRVMFSAGSSVNYPNGTKTESFIQNSAGLAMSVPLFEAGLSKNKTAEYQKTEQMNIEMKEHKKTAFIEGWQKASDMLASLEEQERITAQAVSEAKELSGIIYKSYKAGAATYVEVQNVNFRMLEVKKNLARIKVQELINLAVLASLAEKE
ncbi:MAG: TolC family protein [Elusimicrobiota bacterium]